MAFNASHNEDVERYLENLKTLDDATLIIVVVLGFATFPLAFLIYCRMLTAKKFRGNYTFRLIVTAGIVDFLLYMATLVAIQCTNIPSLAGIYSMLNDRGLAMPLMITFQYLTFLQVSLALSIALNRLISVVRNIFLRSHARSIFLSSLLSSLSISAIVAFIGRPRSFRYKLYYTGNGTYSYGPENVDENRYLLDTILTTVGCSVVLLASVSLALTVYFYRKQLAIERGVALESGLIIVAVCHFVHSILTNIAKMIGAHYKILLVAYSQTLFICIGCVAPFWCLLLFTKSIRKELFPKYRVAMSTTSPDVFPSSAS